MHAMQAGEATLWRDQITRRTVLKTGLGAGAAALAAAGLPTSLVRALAATAGPSQLSDIEHVVFLIQENRSFDHYFGTLSGVRGFSDPHALQQPDGMSVFQQPDADALQNQSGYVMPFRLDTTRTSAQCVADLSHAWSVQHYSWNNAQMDGFVTAHRVGDDGFGAVTPGNPGVGPLTMGYYTRADLPFHYALADAFTVCDAYHCSVFGPTNPNRIMSLSATVDAAGTKGGPCIDNSQNNGQLSWTSYPELLQARGIDWYVYQEADNDTNNMLPLFTAFHDTTTDLYRRGNTTIATPHGQRYGPALAAKLKADVLSGSLPQVSWVLASTPDCEHPSASPAYGARFVASVLDALTADPKVWAKTVLFYTFDENDGFFDHVVPPTPPPGTAGEYLPPQFLGTNPTGTIGWTGPVGLGFRVPMVVISPFTRGGLCCSQTFDHTSLLLFLEKRFGIEVPNISDWRRQTVGDLAAAFDFASGSDISIPALPSTDGLAAAADHGCTALPSPGMPATQAMPAQEEGPRRRQPSGPVAPVNTPEVPWVPALAVAGALAAGIAARRR